MSDEKDESNKAAEKNARSQSEPAQDVHQWLEDVHFATLSTISQVDGIEGFPIGSVAPFAVDSDGKPYILIAEIAAHTKNLLTSNKMNLFIRNPESQGDPQTSWRASLVGNMKRIASPRNKDKFSEEHLRDCIQVTTEEEDILLARYSERVPHADRYLKVHNFSFWKMESILKVRYIAGFGRICWIEGDEMEIEKDSELDEIKQSSIEHMNEDHEDSMITLCEGAYSFIPERVELLDIEPRGILMQTYEPDRLVYSSFGKAITASDLRVEIVKLIKKARANIPKDES